MQARVETRETKCVESGFPERDGKKYPPGLYTTGRAAAINPGDGSSVQVIPGHPRANESVINTRYIDNVNVRHEVPSGNTRTTGDLGVGNDITRQKTFGNGMFYASHIPDTQHANRDFRGFHPNYTTSTAANGDQVVVKDDISRLNQYRTPTQENRPTEIDTGDVHRTLWPNGATHTSSEEIPNFPESRRSPVPEFAPPPPMPRPQTP